LDSALEKMMTIKTHSVRDAMRFFALILCLLAAAPAYSAEITALSIEAGEGAEHVSLRLTQHVKYQVFNVQSLPPRVAVDLEGAQPRGRLGMPANYRGTLIQGVRFGFHNETTGRVVFDLATSVSPRNIRLTGSQGGYLLEFDLPYPQGAAQEDATESFPRHRHEASARPRRAAKPVIIIDAGHGGQDPGTSGRGGTDEKDLTLRYALALKESLLKTGRFRVALTRSDDRYLLLRERVRRARSAHGDLFISLHADSAPTRYARGLSVYTISEKSSDKESEALAAQENKADVIGGMDLSGASDDVAGILIDLTERETRAKSAEFADLAIKYLGRSVGLLSNTHRFAGFAVLKAPDIPSVLVEIGFLTNPSEESQLKSRAYQTKVIRGLTQAVVEYFGKK
jgi:N-acetylmuramoyl-L-alanine amidase